MPVANKYELSEVLNACDVYFEKTGRRVTFEYSLVTVSYTHLQGLKNRRRLSKILLPVSRRQMENTLTSVTGKKPFAMLSSMDRKAM